MPPVAETSFDMNMPLESITPSGALRRAMWACVIGGIGAVIIAAILTYSPFDPTGDTAGTGADFRNFLGTPGANLANWLLQMLGWAALPLGGAFDVCRGTRSFKAARASHSIGYSAA